jgi:hypothetical protein
LLSLSAGTLPDKAQDSLNHGLISRRSIEHGVINRTVRPLDVEVFLDERTPLVVNRIDERFCRCFRFALRNKALYLAFSRSVQEKAQSVVPSAQEML